MIACVTAVLVLLPAVFSEAAKATMPQEAKAEYDLGNAAFDEKNWDSAIQHFTAARKLDERNPKILFNLGLSHSQAGHELPAVAWLEAYLVLVPNDTKAGAIRKEITRLTAVAESKASKILKAAQDACDQLDENDSWGEEEKHYLLKSLADAYLFVGNDARAVATMNRAGPTLGLGYTAEEELYLDHASSMVNDPGHLQPERTGPDSAAEILDRYAQAVKAAAEKTFGYDHWIKVCEAYYYQEDWDGLRKAALKVTSPEEREKWLDLADRKAASEKRDPCGCWTDLAAELSENPRFVDLQRGLKSVTDRDVFWTWTKDKGIRPVDVTWHTITVAKSWCNTLRDVKSIREFIAHQAPKP